MANKVKVFEMTEITVSGRKHVVRADRAEIRRAEIKARMVELGTFEEDPPEAEAEADPPEVVIEPEAKAEPEAEADSPEVGIESEPEVVRKRRGRK